VLAHLVFPDGRADRFSDLAGPAQPAGADPLGDRGEELLGRGQQV